MDGIWASLVWPLLRLLAGLSFGLLIASVLEAFNWTNRLAPLAMPLARLGHFGSVSGAAFSLALVSPASSNGLLSDAWQKGQLSSSELVLANLFNSFPAYLVHLPSLFFMLWPVLGLPAAIYVGSCLFAAFLRTAFTILLGRLILNKPIEENIASKNSLRQITWRNAGKKAWRRFSKRLPKLVFFTIPIYILMYFLQRYGFFALAQNWLCEHMAILSFLKPQAMGIIIFHLAAELGAALGAAGSLLQAGALSAREIIIALLIGNILSTPMRAIRHQLPAYAGFYRPTMALWLVLANQGLRAASMIIVTIVYIVA